MIRRGLNHTQGIWDMPIRHKGFHRLATAIQSDSNSSMEVVNKFKGKMQREWNKGKSLVIASETFDMIAARQVGGDHQNYNTTGNMYLLERLIDILPKSNDTI